MQQIKLIFAEFLAYVKELVKDINHLFGGSDDDDHWNGGYKVAVQ